MASESDEEIVVTDGKVHGRTRIDHWIIENLAKYPGRVTIVTFFAGLTATALVAWASGDDTIVTVVSLLATLWALFFSVMIYLLSAKDTDRVLEQIADLQEQLGAALSSPEESDTGSAPSGVAASPDSGPRPAEAEERWWLSRSEHPDRFTVPESAKKKPAVVRGPEDIEKEVPSTLLSAWKTASAVDPATLVRAWTPNSVTNRQWVLQTEDHRRWLVFARENGGIGVLSLDSDNRRGLVRWFPSR